MFAKLVFMLAALGISTDLLSKQSITSFPRAGFYCNKIILFRLVTFCA